MLAWWLFVYLFVCVCIWFTVSRDHVEDVLGLRDGWWCVTLAQPQYGQPTSIMPRWYIHRYNTMYNHMKANIGTILCISIYESKYRYNTICIYKREHVGTKLNFVLNKMQFYIRSTIYYDAVKIHTGKYIHIHLYMLMLMIMLVVVVVVV